MSYSKADKERWINLYRSLSLDGARIVDLFHNQWISLKKYVDVNRGIHGYVFSHETRCNGKIIAMLPYRVNKGKYEYLLRSEITPCWDGKEQILSTLTGGVEHYNSEIDAIRELKEEAGYRIRKDELISLGHSYASKSSDTIYDLFTVDLTNRKQGKAIGDGSWLEDEAGVAWVSEEKIFSCKDPQAAVMYLRLNYENKN